MCDDDFGYSLARPHPMRTSWVALVLALYASSVHAQSDETSEARIEEAATASRAGDHARALGLLRALVSQERSGRHLAELGQAELAAARPIEAEEHLAEALTMTNERWVRHHRRGIEAALSAARASISELRVTSNIDGAEVLVNGVVMGRIPLPRALRIGIGRVTVEVRARGFRNATREVTVLSGEIAEAHVSLDREGPAPDTNPTPPPPRCAPGLVLRNGLCFAAEEPHNTATSTYRWMAYIGGGVALLSVGLAIGLWADGNSTESAYVSRCGGAAVARTCEADWQTTQDSLDLRAGAVNLLWALGVVSVGVAVTGVVLERREVAARRRLRASVVPLGLRVTW
jgi:hypothetical protein